MTRINLYLFGIIEGTWLVILFMSPSVWGIETDELLSGKAFTDPLHRIEMPQKWMEQSVKYKKWATDADLAITLDQQLYPALLPIIQQYARKKKLDIAVQEGTCGISDKNLKNKAVDIAGFCCPPSKTDRMPGLKFHTLGIAAIALLVHSNNPINNISLKQAQQIFQGHLFWWSEMEVSKGVPGPKRIIRVFGRLHCKQRPGHWRLLLDHEDLFSPRMFEISTIADMIAEVAHEPYAIGYETLWMIKRSSWQNNLKILSLNHIPPTDNTQLVTGTYPLYRTYNVTTWESTVNKNQHAQDLVKYLIEHMEQINPKYGFVSVSKLRKAGWTFWDNELIGEPH